MASVKMAGANNRPLYGEVSLRSSVMSWKGGLNLLLERETTRLADDSRILFHYAMKALVTGGGGFLGLYVVEQLVERGDSVRVFCRGQYDQLDQLGVEVCNGDIRDPAAVATAVQGCDTVFHCAAVPGVWGSWEMYHGINTLGTENVITGCRTHGTGKLIYTSSPSVVFDGEDHFDADELLPYPASYMCHYPHSKMLAEKSVLAANGIDGLATAALRPHLIWGPRDNHLIPRLIQRAKSGRLRVVGDGKNKISMAYVENAAAAHLQAADALTLQSAVAGNAYFINEPQPVVMWEWITELLQIAGLPPVTKTISQNSAARIGRVLECVWSTLRLKGEPTMTRFVAAQLAGSHCYSVARAQRDFGYKGIVTVADGMRRITEELQQLGSAT